MGEFAEVLALAVFGGLILFVVECFRLYAGG